MRLPFMTRRPRTTAQSREFTSGRHLPIAVGVDRATAPAARAGDRRPALLTALARQHSAWRQLVTARADRFGDPTMPAVLQVKADREFDDATDQLQRLLDDPS